MGLHLIAAGIGWHGWALAAFGLGLLIFVHELGHFAVAKWCGVKCEKFYLGFDIFGLTLLKFRFGETEYGIGILPLGGYVKMLGQDDNPAQAAKERERAKALQAGTAAEGFVPGQTVETQADALDPRSYLAQSVPERMAIISAGVIMNLILAFALATLAYGLGVEELSCKISSAQPGEAAWRAGMQPGDEIIEINDRKLKRPLAYSDLVKQIVVGSNDQGIRFKIHRGRQEPFVLTVKPDTIERNGRLRPTIGVLPGMTTRLGDPAVIPDSPAANAKTFKKGDQIVSVDERFVSSWVELMDQLARKADRPVRIGVRRGDEAQGSTKNVEITVAPRPLRTLGLKMALGPIAAVQAESPAAQAGLRAGDVIQSVGGLSPADLDALLLPDFFWRKGRDGEAVKLAIVRPSGARKELLELDVRPRDLPWADRQPTENGGPLYVPALGITLQLTSVIHAVDEQGPARDALVKDEAQPAKSARLAAGDEIVRVEFVPAEEKFLTDEWYADTLGGITLSEKQQTVNTWLAVANRLPLLPPGTKARLLLSGDRSVEIPVAESRAAFHPDRGLRFYPDTIKNKAGTLGEAIELGWDRTVDSALIVYRFLGALVGGRVSPKNLGGIGSITTGIAASASSSWSDFLMMLVAISANLAVLNMLPIPVLDGGHMVFLIWEGVRRKPPSEKVQIALTWLGAAVILALMLYTNGLDLFRLIDWLRGN